MHTKSISPMAITRSAILETTEYQNMSKVAGAGNAITMALSTLGMDLSTLSSNYGLIRTLSNPEDLFYDWVYVGMTRADFKYKNLYDTVQVIYPQNFPINAIVIKKSEINYDEINWSELARNSKRVKTPKYKPEIEE